MIDCRRARARFREYLDGEIEGLNVYELVEHIEECRECFSEMEFEGMLKRIVRKFAAEESLGPLFKEKLQQTILRGGK